MNDRELMYLPAYEQRKMIIKKMISSVEITEAALRRVKLLDSDLHSFITIDEEGALRRAAEADKEIANKKKLGIFHGVPVSIKDLEVTRGLKTTLGSGIFSDWVPDYDSIVVERVRESGAVIIGKTNTPEFGNREETFTNFFPTCNNPWDEDKIPGGSSGGAAVSVASGMCSIATGTDGGGSVRLPAAFCGIFGHKPTQGRVPRFGGQGKPSFNTTSTSGPMTNDVLDGALMLQVMSGFDKRDPGSLRSEPDDFLRGLEDGVDGLKIGVSPTLGFATINDDVMDSIEESVKTFKKLGAKVSTVSLKLDPLPSEYWWEIWTAGQVAMYGHLVEEHTEELMPYTLEMIKHGYTVTGAAYAVALRKAEELRLKMADYFSEYDLLLTPVAAVTAWEHLSPPVQIGTTINKDKYAGISYGAIPFTMAFNISWNPAASIPCGFGKDKMPIGLQIVADLNMDALVMRASRAFEQAKPWKHLRPPLS